MDKMISIVIRTYNEQKHIREVMEILSKQTYKNFEIILIDSESTDDTIKIVSEYKKVLSLKILKIKKKDFDYSYASNMGVQHASGDIICFLSGHSVPVYTDYLSEINKVFKNEIIGGCYGDVIALDDGSLYEKIYNKLGVIKNKIIGKGNETVVEKTFHKGMLSCSNASIRRDVLLNHPFAKELGKNGGEDLEVAYRILQDGMYIAMVPRLLVKHSHGKNLIEFIKELKNWKKIYNEVIQYINNTKE